MPDFTIDPAKYRIQDNRIIFLEYEGDIYNAESRSETVSNQSFIVSSLVFTRVPFTKFYAIHVFESSYVNKLKPADKPDSVYCRLNSKVNVNFNASDSTNSIGYKIEIIEVVSIVLSAEP